MDVIWQCKWTVSRFGWAVCEIYSAVMLVNLAKRESPLGMPWRWTHDHQVLEDTVDLSACVFLFSGQLKLLGATERIIPAGMSGTRARLRMLSDMHKRTREILPLLPSLRRYAIVLARDESAAEYLVQGTLLHGWLMSILHNTFVDTGRADARAKGALTQVRAAFFRLPEDQREVLHLIAVEEMSYAKEAALLHVPQGTWMACFSLPMPICGHSRMASRRGFS